MLLIQIFFSKLLLSETTESQADISIVVDIDWRGYYDGRKEHPIEEAENVIFNANNEVLKIGKILTERMSSRRIHWYVEIYTSG